ncbi:MAG: GNAT family N-acetyltransferase [Anaerolineae bacterium]|nr:GNAT family N-acetyltransferase [Anaerolineae bacterium]
MELQVYDQVTLFDELQSEWNPLVERSTSNRIFSTWEWKSVWWQAYQPGELWVVTCRSDDGQMLGIAPWFIANSEERGRVVSTIGCKEVTDYLDLIVDQAYVDQVLPEFARFLRDAVDRFDHIFLCNIPEESISYQKFPSVLEEYGFISTLIPEDVCPIIKLPTTWDDYLSMLDKKNRHELRRKMRRSQGVNTDIDWYIVGAGHDVQQELEHFLEMMAASAAEKATFLEDKQNVAFFKALVPVLYEQGWLQLNFLTVDGVRAAAYLNFDYNEHISVYNSGLLPDEFGHLSPGIVLLVNNIRHAIETKHKVFDFLQGDENYKYRMGGQDTHVYNLEAVLEERA